jgi:hypothetical protein
MRLNRMYRCKNFVNKNEEFDDGDRYEDSEVPAAPADDEAMIEDEIHDEPPSDFRRVKKTQQPQNPIAMLKQMTQGMLQNIKPLCDLKKKLKKTLITIREM